MPFGSTVLRSEILSTCFLLGSTMASNGGCDVTRTVDDDIHCIKKDDISRFTVHALALDKVSVCGNARIFTTLQQTLKHQDLGILKCPHNRRQSAAAIHSSWVEISDLSPTLSY